MKYYVKIIYQYEYKNRYDNVNRPLIRAFQKIGAQSLLEAGNRAILLGYFKDGKIYELFTNNRLDYNSYHVIKEANANEILGNIDATSLDKISKIIRKIIFDEDVNLDFEVSSMEDLALDRAKQFDAYEKGLTKINPYDIKYVKRLSNKPSSRRLKG